MTPVCYVVASSDWSQAMRAIGWLLLLLPAWTLLITVDWWRWEWRWRRWRRRERIRRIRQRGAAA